MKDSMYSIHDLSRMSSLKDGDLPRFNMPFECGIDFGLKYSGKKSLRKKKLLILETKKYRYQKVISDIAGSDIKSHKDNPEKVIQVVRDWFSSNNHDCVYSKEIWLAFNEFCYDNDIILSNDNINPNDIFALTFRDTIKNMYTWIENYRKYNSA